MKNVSLDHPSMTHPVIKLPSLLSRQLQRYLAPLCTFVICMVLVEGHAQETSLDDELASMAQKLSTQVKESGKKKVTVLDLTDLQGNTSELGRFLSEQISVHLVEHRTGFSVMDRANLKTILAEHKLTVDGLVEPENAKKLGQFSGVDAIVLGNITVLKDEIAITSKIIATDTAEIVGAARAKISKSKDIASLLGTPSTVESTAPVVEVSQKPAPKPVPAPTEALEKDSQKIGDLVLKLQSLKMTHGSSSADFTAVFSLQNVSSTKSLGVGMHLNGYPLARVYNDKGDEFQPFEQATGLECSNTGGNHSMTEIGPGETIRCTLKFQGGFSNNQPGDYPPYRFQAELYTGIPGSNDDRYKKANFVVELDKLK
jgi:TolB-like protein